MEKLTALNLSFDKILLQILIPGLIFTFPYFLVYLDFHPLARNYFYLNQSVTIIAISFISIIAGMLLENIGSRFEVFYLDKSVKKEYDDFDIIWEKFLQITYHGHEPVGHRYLRNILFRMKFEISAGIGLLPMIVGLCIHSKFNPIFESFFWNISLLIIAPLVISFYLLFVEARSSSKILANTRKLLVEKYGSEIAK